MKSAQLKDRFVVRLERGEEVMETLTAFLKEKNITAASVSGIGAVTDVTLMYYRLETKTYEEEQFTGEYEVLSLLGNVALKDGNPFAHLHITLGRDDYSTVGGHLAKATVSVTLELVLDVLDGTVARTPDEETGLALLDLHS